MVQRTARDAVFGHHNVAARDGARHADERFGQVTLLLVDMGEHLARRAGVEGAGARAEGRRGDAGRLRVVQPGNDDRFRRDAEFVSGRLPYLANHGVRRHEFGQLAAIQARHCQQILVPVQRGKIVAVGQ